MYRTAVCCVVCVGLWTSAASSATITTYNRAAFQTALSGGTLSGQDFDSLAAGTVLGTLDGVTYGASGGNPIVTDSYLTSTTPNGLGSTSVGYFLSSESATFTFATAITAFAIDINTFAAFEGAYTATLNLGDVVSSRFDVFPNTSTGQFLGFTSDVAFTSVTISAVADPGSGATYAYTLDSLVYGEAAAVAVPEPSSLVLCGLASFVGCGVWARRRRVA
ncbi:PEP-CTERM sorting domain-containing protein [Planctomyces sp. SH-PL62]|uniref:PEP-CTERM sorting domain-containing protein n=1 Tax=Planctomyces sp. SH-PL62 TaxID=1636152 RepID=UPI00078ED511|nr:PEP-CTERM sorting domain-containing protein [Planctomyces sp. SH-PL62]AMV39969.1 hypothetical protein VT85_21225 [Planctomyces sp. SH-PL62]